MYPRAGNREWKIVPTVLEPGAAIGAGAIIRCGVRLGAFFMIGAGAIVCNDVPAFHLAVGFQLLLPKNSAPADKQTLS